MIYVTNHDGIIICCDAELTEKSEKVQLYSGITECR